MRLLCLLALMPGLVACPEDGEGIAPDRWPVWPREAAVPDQRPPDLGPDLPPPPDCAVADAATMGWRVAYRAAQPLNGVACAEGHVFAAGDQGTLLHRAPDSSACGFVAQQVPTSADLLTVSFAGLAYGATAGEDPAIWETRDGGRSWSVAPQCGDVKFHAFYELHLHSVLKGFGAGVTDDQASAAYKIFAGKTWICPGQTFAGQSFLGTFRQGDSGWFVGDTKGRIYHTPDEAVTWFYFDSSTAKPLRSVYFTAAGVGLAVGDDGAIQRSTDGIGWSQVMTLGNDDLEAVYFRNDQQGWAVGQNGTILHSIDAGKTWGYQLAPVSERLTGVCFTSDTEGWAVGQGGTILTTGTAGQ